MFEMLPYLSCLDQVLSSTLMRQLTVITTAMLCCRGRVTMLNLSRWSSKGGRYRSIQRFYNSSVSWLSVNWALFCCHQLRNDEVYLLVGDETTVTKSGKSTYGLGRFFSSIYSRAVPGIGFFSLCLVGISSEQASPLLMEQLAPDMKKQTKVQKVKIAGTGKKGRPKASKNKNRQDIELTNYLKWIQGNIQKTLNVIGDNIKIAYYVYDGAFGNNECLQMVKSCGLLIISKLQCKSALWFPYTGEYNGKGPRKKYGDKVNYHQLPLDSLMSTTSENGVQEKIYQLKVWHRDFPDQLNVTIIQRKRVSDDKIA
ncbi:MAG: transposase [SAR324 cluster bacterium]|nr:transposase [SAR324 cluster bacterium]